MQVYVDMDGVLADFDAHHERVFGVRSSKLADDVDWTKVRAVKGFYADIPPMADMRELWDFVSRLTPKPIVLTASLLRSKKRRRTNAGGSSITLASLLKSAAVCPRKSACTRGRATS